MSLKGLPKDTFEPLLEDQVGTPALQGGLAGTAGGRDLAGFLGGLLGGGFGGKLLDQADFGGSIAAKLLGGRLTSQQ